ncbi:MAG TPA: hypothetical protein VFC44_11180 [Candidatus Saccharimonadales bacterium]|nr:hypothetical protein [Candidatus Saccharimonadales bacterium]
MILFFLTPFPLEALEAAYLPDLCHMSFLAVFFLLLIFEYDYCALALLFAAFLVRENTLLLCLATAVLSWRKRRKALAYGSIVVLVAGTCAGGAAARAGVPNTHHWPEWLYLAVRVPHDFLANILGVVVETNVHRVFAGQWQWTIPVRWRIGLDHEIYLTLYWRLPIRTLTALLSLFGCAPALVVWAWKRVKPLAGWELPLQIAFCYGLVCFLLGTSLGASVTRLIGYGWPLFWIWLPAALAKLNPRLGPIRITALAVCYLVAAWLPNLVGLQDISLALLLIPVMYVAGWKILTKPPGEVAVHGATT